jgi:hypothetical protein
MVSDDRRASHRPTAPHDPKDLDGYVLDFGEDFDAPTLDRSRWLPHYLPQWSSRSASEARYELTGSSLRLRIDEDQEPWCPEVDGAIRVSSLQTGCRSGPVGSRDGQHRFDPRLTVREVQPEVRLYAPTYGYVETRLRGLPLPGYMVALWMIGFEDEPTQSGEICVCELFGHRIGRDSSEIRFGLHPFDDPRMSEEFVARPFPIDASEFHVYAVDWTPDGVDFYLDGRRIHRSAQSPDYPMQLMLGAYELPALLPDGVRSAPWPKVFEIDYVRVYRSAAEPEPPARSR